MARIYYTREVNGDNIPGFYDEVAGAGNNIDMSNVTEVSQSEYETAVTAYTALQEQREQERAIALEQAVIDQEADLSPKRQNVLDGMASTNMTNQQVNDFAELSGWEERV